MPVEQDECDVEKLHFGPTEENNELKLIKTHNYNQDADKIIFYIVYRVVPIENDNFRYYDHLINIWFTIEKFKKVKNQKELIICMMASCIDYESKNLDFNYKISHWLCSECSYFNELSETTTFFNKNLDRLAKEFYDFWGIDPKNLIRQNTKNKVKEE